MDQLQEAQKAFSFFSSIAQNYAAPPVFFSPSMMRRLEYSKSNILAFHGTNLKGLGGIRKIQKRKTTQLSVTSGNGPSMLRAALSGVETSGGVLVALRGEVSAAFSFDAFTGRIRSGIRSVLIDDGTRSDFAQSVLSFGGFDVLHDMLIRLKAQLQSAIDTAYMQQIVPSLRKAAKSNPTINTLLTTSKDRSMQKKLDLLNETYLSAREAEDTATSKALGTAANALITSYLDTQEDILRNSPAYRQLFVWGLAALPGTELAVDELLMSDFTIESVLLNMKEFLWRPLPRLLSEIAAIDEAYFNAAFEESGALEAAEGKTYTTGIGFSHMPQTEREEWARLCIDLVVSYFEEQGIPVLLGYDPNRSGASVTDFFLMAKQDPRSALNMFRTS